MDTEDRSYKNTRNEIKKGKQLKQIRNKKLTLNKDKNDLIF